MFIYFKKHLYSAERKKTQTLSPFYFKLTKVTLLLFQIHSGDGNRQQTRHKEWAVLGVEMGTSLPREGIAMETGYSDSWHVLPLLCRWTVSESCHEGLHHHFWMQYCRRWKKQSGSDGHKVKTVPMQTSFCRGQSLFWVCLSRHPFPPCPVRIHPGEVTFLTLSSTGLIKAHDKLQHWFARSLVCFGFACVGILFSD